MSMPSWMMMQFRQQEELAATKTPYDPSVPSKVIITQPSVEPHQTTVVWDKNPWDMFERKVVLAYTGNKRRIELLKQEFSRVGLDDVEVLWNFNDAYLKLYSDVKCVHFTSDWLAILNNTLGHYRIIKTSYELGYSNCLIMEDDVRFLRDVSLIEKILKSAPLKYEVLMLDSHAPSCDWKEKKHAGDKVSEYWRKVVNRTSAACYALSKEGMEKFIAIYEQALYSSDSNFNCNVFSRIFYADPNAARQVLVEESKTNTHYENWSQLYDIMGCPRVKYGK